MKAGILRTICQIPVDALHVPARLARIQESVDESKILAARVLINQMRSQGMYENIHEADQEILVKHVHAKQRRDFGASRFEESPDAD